MEITITLGELNEVVSSLNNLVKVPLAAKYAYRFQKVAKFLQAELLEFKKQHDDLVRRFGETTEDGSQIKVKTENLEQYFKERDDLLVETISLQFEPLPVSVLDDVKVTIQDMAWLEKFFADDTAPVTPASGSKLNLTSDEDSSTGDLSSKAGSTSPSKSDSKKKVMKQKV